MKPSPKNQTRLPAIPWTFDDADIWRYYGPGPVEVWRYVHADRQDADCMFELGQARWTYGEYLWPAALHALWTNGSLADALT